MLTEEQVAALLKKVRLRLPRYVRRIWGSHRLDWDGDPYVEVFVVIDDKVVDRFLEGRWSWPIQRTLRDHFQDAGVDDFVLAIFRSVTEQKEVEEEEEAERRAALPRRKRRPKQRKRA
jgi:hypothetical protein